MDDLISNQNLRGDYFALLKDLKIIILCSKTF